MAMADTTPSKVYDIAEQLGYEGARTQSSAKAVNACADALGFVGPHSRRITDALTDLKSVVGGGGGGGGNVLVVNMEGGSGSQATKMMADKTAKEICDAASAGALVFAITKAGPATQQYQLAGSMHMNDTYGVSFAEVQYMSNNGNVLVVSLDLDGSAADGTTYTFTSKTLTPSS